jgi:hypothetical protein
MEKPADTLTRKRLASLQSIEYEHPFDRASLDRLENTRGLDLLTRKVLDFGLEKYLLIKHTGNNIRVSRETLPELTEILEEACEILSVPEVPELYIFLEDKIRSFTTGEARRVIVLSSGAIDLMSRDELLFMIGREIGHIKSNHVLYHMMADSLDAIMQLMSDISLGISNLLAMPLKVALLHWHRMSEFSADRAGLLACQDMEVAAQSLIKIAGLPQAFHGRIPTAEFREQSRAFDTIGENTFDKLIRFIAGYENRQPFTVIRASQLFQWEEAGAYDKILKRETIDRDQGQEYVCLSPRCPYPFEKDEYFCRECGKRILG